MGVPSLPLGVALSGNSNEKLFWGKTQIRKWGRKETPFLCLHSAVRVCFSDFFVLLLLHRDVRSKGSIFFLMISFITWKWSHSTELCNKKKINNNSSFV